MVFLKHLLTGVGCALLIGASPAPMSAFTPIICTIERLDIRQIVDVLDELAELYNVYEEWPTLYKANNDTDTRNHFLKFAKHERWVVFVARDENHKIIGCLTGLPLDECDARYKEAFMGKELPPKTYNIKDCLVSKKYRNQGVATRLYRELETYLKGSGKYKSVSVAITHRDETFHQQRPQGALPSHKLWEKFGFKKVFPGRYSTSWTLVGEDKPFDNAKDFWIKHLSQEK